MATKEKTKKESAEDPIPVDTGKRDAVREQEDAEKSAQEIVRERHMSPNSFK